MPLARISFGAIFLALLLGMDDAVADAPPHVDYCLRLQQEIQGKKHGFLAGNTTYYVGGFHASWNPVEQETLGLTHPFCHDLRSRGVGYLQSRGLNHENTGLGNDFSGWEFYKDTRVLYGSVRIDGELHRYPVPSKMYWRPDRMICEYEVAGVRLREEKFIAANDAACSVITASRPVTLRFDGQSFFGRHSVSSTASIEFDQDAAVIHILEGGTTKCRPEIDRSERVGPIMYDGMSTVLAASRDYSSRLQFSNGERGQCVYEFELECDSDGVVLAWAMHDEYEEAVKSVHSLLGQPTAIGNRTALNALEALEAKRHEMNRQLNEEIPWFRCSEKKFEDIYYYLWALYLQYYIDVGRGWEREPHTQSAVNNFLGMHRYDATFQIPVGAWTGNKPHYAYGNVLTWKHLFRDGHYRKSPNGTIALSDNKGTTWHSGVYGNELSEHVLGAWQIYEHTGDIAFVRDCYEGYFREVFHDQIAPFASNHFEVAAVLIRMAQITDHIDDVEHWQSLVPSSEKDLQNWFDQRWQANGHADYFAGPQDGMMMTNGFWHMRSSHFPRTYALRMTRSWALDRDKGFMGEIFPLAMSRQAMKIFSTDVDHSFGSTPDTAYFTLSGMFRQRLGDPAWRLTLKHLENYNFNTEWGIPVAPEAYTRSGERFGDQYSNFNAGKILLYLEGLAGLEYSIPDDRLVVRDTMPTVWEWMELRIPIQMPGNRVNQWTMIRYDRSTNEGEIEKTITVHNSPLQVTIEPWSEGKRVAHSVTTPSVDSPSITNFPEYSRFSFEKDLDSARVSLRLEVGTD